jgi:anti-sigma factor RsiW
MNCKQFKQDAAAFRDGELDPARQSLAAQHLGECPECARWFQNEAAFEADLNRHLNSGEADRDFWRNLEAQAVREITGLPASPAVAKSHEAQTSWWRQLLWPNPLFYAAMAIVWLGLILVDSSTLPAKRAGETDAPMTFQNAPAVPPSEEVWTQCYLISHHGTIDVLLGMEPALPAVESRKSVPLPRTERFVHAEMA